MWSRVRTFEGPSQLWGTIRILALPKCWSPKSYKGGGSRRVTLVPLLRTMTSSIRWTLEAYKKLPTLEVLEYPPALRPRFC